MCRGLAGPLGTSSGVVDSRLSTVVGRDLALLSVVMAAGGPTVAGRRMGGTAGGILRDFASTARHRA